MVRMQRKICVPTGRDVREPSYQARLYGRFRGIPLAQESGRLQNGYDFLKSRILLVRWWLPNGKIKFKERFGFRFKRNGDLDQVLQRDIAFASFDPANMGIMEPAAFGKLS